MDESKGIQGGKSPQIRRINQKAKGHSIGKLRKRIDQQLKLGGISIAAVKIPLKSRDELPPILMALQHLYVTPELKAAAIRILEEKILKGKKKTGRYGMDLWHILVLSVVRMGLDAGWKTLPTITACSGR